MDFPETQQQEHLFLEVRQHDDSTTFDFPLLLYQMHFHYKENAVNISIKINNILNGIK